MVSGCLITGCGEVDAAQYYPYWGVVQAGCPSLITSRIYLAHRERRKFHLLSFGGMTSGLVEALRAYLQLDS